MYNQNRLPPFFLSVCLLENHSDKEWAKKGNLLSAVHSPNSQDTHIWGMQKEASKSSWFAIWVAWLKVVGPSSAVLSSTLAGSQIRSGATEDSTLIQNPYFSRDNSTCCDTTLALATTSQCDVGALTSKTLPLKQTFFHFRNSLLGLKVLILGLAAWPSG